MFAGYNKRCCLTGAVWSLTGLPQTLLSLDCRAVVSTVYFFQLNICICYVLFCFVIGFMFLCHVCFFLIAMFGGYGFPVTHFCSRRFEPAADRSKVRLHRSQLNFDLDATGPRWCKREMMRYWCWWCVQVCRATGVIDTQYLAETAPHLAAEWHRLSQSKSLARSWILLKVNIVFVVWLLSSLLLFELCF